MNGCTYKQKWLYVGSTRFQLVSDSPQSPIVEKIRTIAQRVYGAADIELSAEAKDKIEYYNEQVRSAETCMRLPPSLPHVHARAHSHSSLVVARRASARCPSAWPRPTCLCPTCPTRRERRAGSSCPSETSAPASGPDSSTRWWGRWVQLV